MILYVAIFCKFNFTHSSPNKYITYLNAIFVFLLKVSMKHFVFCVHIDLLCITLCVSIDASCDEQRTKALPEALQWKNCGLHGKIYMYMCVCLKTISTK